MPILPAFIYNFTLVPIETPSSVLCIHTYSKVYMERTDPRIVKAAFLSCK